MLEAGGRFEDPDAMFHAHRVVRTVAEGRLLPPVLDSFENFPDGGRALWPPLHDATLALAARLGGSTAADPKRGLPVAAAVPVAELVLALLLAARLARSAGGPRGELLAAWLFALTPCLPRRGAFGELDHNLTEVLFVLLLVLAATSIARREGAGGRGLRDPRLSSLLWASVSLIALGFYAGLVLAAGLAAAGVAAHDLLSPERRALPRLSLGFGLAALALPVFASLRVKPLPDDPWRLGPTYVLILAIGAAGTGLFSLAVSARRGFRKEADLFGAGGVLTGAAAMLVTTPLAWRALSRGFGFLGSRDPWLSTIDEFQPLFTAREALVAALPALPVALAALAFALLAWRRREVAGAERLALLSAPFLAYAALALVQKRFLPVAAALGATAGGAAWESVRENAAAKWTVRSLFVAGLLPAASGFLIPYAGLTLRGEAVPAASWSEVTAGVLARTTPAPGNPPEWGVLAPWGDGHTILWRSGRAVALNNFGDMQPGFARSEALWLETSPAVAVEELSRLRLRYVVASWPPNVVPPAARGLGRDPKMYFARGFARDAAATYAPTPLGERTLLVRLHLYDAKPFTDDSEADRRALARFRLLFTSEEAGPGPRGAVPFLKIFELAP